MLKEPSLTNASAATIKNALLNNVSVMLVLLLAQKIMLLMNTQTVVFALSILNALQAIALHNFVNPHAIKILLLEVTYLDANALTIMNVFQTYVFKDTALKNVMILLAVLKMDVSVALTQIVLLLIV